MHSSFSLRLILISLSFFVALAHPVSAQGPQHGNWNDDYDPYIASLGLAVGYTSGTGIAVRWPALTQTMVGVAGGAWGKSSDLAWNLGCELHYVLRQVGRTRLFLGPGLGLLSDGKNDKTNVNVSLNIGVEMLMRSRVAFKADLGFTYLGKEETVYPLPQLAVLYYF